MREFRSTIFKRFVIAVLAAGLSFSGLLVLAQKSSRTPLKPSKLILMKPPEDIKLGLEASQDAEKELNLIQNPRVNAYVSGLGKQLAGFAPGEKYPYQFKVVDDKNINAFALPGGFVYVNRGIFDHADNEAQLAGVMSHEIGHVALRHSAAKVSQSTLTQGLLQVVGGLVGNKGAGGMLSKVGMKGMDLLLLKNSRGDENEADLMGTQILYDGGYDTNAMVRFFEKIEAVDKGGTQFLSDHPSPPNRIDSVKKEIDKLGGSRPNPKTDTPEFKAVKALVMALPEPKPKTKPAAAPASAVRAPAPPSNRYVQANLGDVALTFPDNWQVTGSVGNATLAPNGGLVSGNLTYGMIVATFMPTPSNRRLTLQDSTSQLLAMMQKGNPQLSVSTTRSIRIGGQSALSVELANQSPAGGKEIDVVVTVLRPSGVLDYFVAVAPQKDFAQYQDAFNKILTNVQFR